MNQHSENRKDHQGYGRNFLDVRLYVLISSYLCKGAVLDTIQKVIQGGADAVQLREKTMGEDEYLILAREVRRLTAKEGIIFIVNDHARVADKVDADGLHIGQSDISIQSAQKIIGDNKIIGVSTHNTAQAIKAEREGADYISVGPIYPTKTKDYEPPVGLEYLNRVKEEIKIPFVAIGGINLFNLHEVLEAGGARIVICSAILCSKDIVETTRSFKKQIIYFESQKKSS